VFEGAAQAADSALHAGTAPVAQAAVRSEGREAAEAARSAASAIDGGFAPCRRGHHLSAPPRGYHWVQMGGDYVLVAIATGVILQLLLNH
jgi:hypothetical protein